MKCGESGREQIQPRSSRLESLDSQPVTLMGRVGSNPTPGATGQTPAIWDVHFLVRNLSAPLMHPTYSKPLSMQPTLKRVNLLIWRRCIPTMLRL